MRFRFALLTLAACSATGVLAQPTSNAPEPLALVNATVLDTVNGTVQRGVVIVLRSGKIESIGAGAAPAGVRTLDVRGRYVLPGLIDAHVHIANLRALRTALEGGVTTVRSSGVSNYVDVGMRELVRQGAVVGPDVFAAGYHVRPTLAEEAYFDHPSLAPLMRGGVVTIDAMKTVVQANLSRNVDWIKVLATERAGTPDTDPRKQVYTEAELAVLVAEANARGVPVMAHAHGAEGALAAVKAGVRSIEHGTYLTDDTLKLMVQRGTFFDPTADIVNDLAAPGGDYDNAGLQRRGQMLKPVLLDTIRRARTAGVKVVTGSDTGYGSSSMARVPREILELIDAGYTPLAALQAATTVNAELLRLEKLVGQVRAGFEADLIVVDANPLEQPRTLLDPLLVVSNGRLGLDRLTFGKSAGARAPGLGKTFIEEPVLKEAR
jgi:imidazolonepropionase-like amidohydrolase